MFELEKKHIVKMLIFMFKATREGILESKRGN